jgi:3-hydroxyisobutyrate dehydrogenase-like beta-hydroxyacid dehydrogenase
VTETAGPDGGGTEAGGIVGVVGLGTMGGAMARHLLAAGHRVIGRDVRPACVAALRAAGGEEASSPAAVAAGAGLVILSLPSVAAFEDVVSGEDGLLAAARPGLAVVEMSTLPLAVKEQAAQLLADRGAVLLDCPISGTGAQIVTKDIVIYASGEAAALARARPVLAAFSRASFDLGAFGNGTRLKFVANLLVAIHNVAAAEALLLAGRAGLDLPAALAALTSGAGTSRMLEVRGPLMIDGDYGAAMRVQTFQKDLDIIGAFARQLGCPTPLLATAAQLNLAALAQGRANDDTASVFAVLQQLAGLPARPPAVPEGTGPADYDD